MGIKRLEDIIAWQKAKELTIQVIKSFGGSKDVGFKDQIHKVLPFTQKSKH